MRKSLTLLLLVLGAFCLSARYVRAADTTYYLDAENGNDSRDGKSEANAWKTLDFAMTKANSFTQGDKLLLKRGQTFISNVNGYTTSSSGTAAKPLTLGSYGTADRPIIKNNHTTNGTVIFHFTGSNWLIDGIEIDNDRIAAVTINGRSIQVSRVYNGLWLSGNNITVNNVRIRHVMEAISPQGINNIIKNSEIAELYPYHLSGTSLSAPTAIFLADIQSAANNTKITNNYIHDVNAPDKDGNPSGNAILMYGLINQVTIDKNRIENTHTVMEIGPSNNPNHSISNVKFQYNLVKNIRRFVYFHSSNNTQSIVISSIYIDNNSVKNDMGKHLDIGFQWTGSPAPTLVHVRNNIFAFPTVTKWADSFTYTRQNNLYYVPDGQSAPGSVAALPLSTGEKKGNPQFRVGLGFNEFKVLSTSPALNAGQNLGLTGDYFGTPVYSGEVDIGAIEYKDDELVYCRADINKDTFVDLTDYSKLVGDFFKSAGSLAEPRTDISQDGFVDISDYSLLVAEFFTYCDPTLNLVGTNSGWFDEGNNLDIINMVKAKSNSTKAPITVLADVNASDYTLSNMLWKAGQASSLVMLRIVGIDANTSIAQVQSLRDKLNTASFYPDVPTLVVLGNEVNNLDVEWRLCPGTTCPNRTIEAGTAYGNLFREFSNGAKFVAVPAPLDQYNAVYPDWQGFVNAAGVYGVGQTLVANVYDLNTNDPTDTQKWLQYQGNVVAFTEYGPSPFDMPLSGYPNFYKNNPPPVPSTTLVRDTCNDPNPFDSLLIWLYYIQGRIFNKQGEEVNLNCN